jgi:hypothetical protein
MRAGQPITEPPVDWQAAHRLQDHVAVALLAALG